MNKKAAVFVVCVLLLLAGGAFWWWRYEKKAEKLDVVAQVQVQVVDKTKRTEAELADGAKIILPPGAAPTGTVVTAQRLDPATGPSLPEWSSCLISLYGFEVDHPFQNYIFIQFPLPQEEELFVLGHYHNGRWEIAPFTAENGLALIEVDELSLFGWLEANPEWFGDKMVDFLTTRWVETTVAEPFCQDPYEEIIVDKSNAFGFLSGCAQKTSKGEIRLTIRNEAPIHLDVYPLPEDGWRVIGPVASPKVIIWLSIYPDGTILAPQDVAGWTVQLDLEDEITFEAYLSESAFAAWFGDAIPYGRFSRGLIESSLFAHSGREMTWGDIKSVVTKGATSVFEAMKSIKNLRSEHILERGRIRFSLKPTSEFKAKFKARPEDNAEQKTTEEQGTRKIELLCAGGVNATSAPQKTKHLFQPSLDVKAKIEQNLNEWVQENLPVNHGILQDYPVEVYDYTAIEGNAWAVGYGFMGYGYVLYSPDNGETWMIQWREEQKLFGGLYPYAVCFSNKNEGWVGGKSGLLYTNDGGSSWEFRKGPVSKHWGDWLAGFRITGNQHLWVLLRNEESYESLDGGKTWKTKEWLKLDENTDRPIVIERTQD